MFEIKLFGAIEISQAGTRLTDFRSQKTLVLLAYLICEQREITRDYLAGLFWPETDQTTALGHLRRALYDLGKKLPDVLTVTRRTVLFEPSAQVAVDVAQFAQLMQSEKLSDQLAALELAQAQFAEGVYLAQCIEVETWMAGQREHWRQRVATLLEQVTARQQADGAFAAALQSARQWVRWEPWRETAHRTVMELLARLRQRRAIDAQYQQCQAALRDELGIDISAETTTYYQRLRSLPHPDHNLPSDKTLFIGRTDERQRLHQLLHQPHIRLLTLTGIGGIGKTRLARAVAHTVRPRFLDGVWYLNLTGLTTGDQLPNRLADVLGIVISAKGDARKQVIAYLGDRELLLLLDNFEQLVEDSAEWLADILAATSKVKLLVTSRQALQLTEEWLYSVEGLPFAAAGERDVIDSHAAQLFTTAARRLRHNFDAANAAAAVADICQVVQGVPLALELAAASIRTLSCSAIAAALHDDINALADPRRNAPDRHRTLRAVFNHSWQLLTAELQQALAKLSVFRGGFSAEAARTVTNVDTAILAQLIDHSLLTAADADRYELHELIRQFAFDKLTDRAAPIQQQHANYFLNWIGVAFDSHLPAPTIAADLDNITIAWDHAIATNHWSAIATAAQPFALHLHFSGATQTARTLITRALAACSDSALSAELSAINALLLVWLQQFDQALALIDTLLQQQPPPSVVIKVQYAQTVAKYEQSHTKEALQIAQSTYEIAHATNNQWWQYRLQTQIARTQLRLHQTDSAERAFLEVLAYCQRVNNHRETIAQLVNLGYLNLVRGDGAAAERYLQQAAQLVNQHHNAYYRPIVEENLGAILASKGNSKQALVHFDRAAVHCRRQGNELRLGLALYGMGNAQLTLGRYTDARNNLLETLALFRKQGSAHRELYVHLALAYVARAVANYKTAWQALDSAFQLADRLENEQDRLYVICAQLGTALMQPDLARAQVAYQQLQRAAKMTASCRALWSVYAAWYLEWHGDLDAAQQRATEGITMAKQHWPQILPLAQLQAGYVALQQQQWESAAAHFTAALDLFTQQSTPHLAGEAHANLAYLATQRNDLAGAQQHLAAVHPHLTGRHPLAGTQRPAHIQSIVDGCPPLEAPSSRG